MAKSNKLKGNRFHLSGIAAALCLAAPFTVQAAGLGNITVLSPLGQPLRAEIDLNAANEELPSMNARLASPEAFRQIGIEYVPAVSGVRFTLDKRKDGRSFIRVATDRPVNEPFLDMLVELTWASGRVVREYTVLLDPPESLMPPASTALVAAPKTSKSAGTESVAPKPVQPQIVAPASSTPSSVAGSSKTPSATSKAEQSSAASDAGDSVTVKRGDSLTGIVAAAKPEGVTLDQMLVATLRGNPDAFDNGNMNRLKSGRILTLPSKEAAEAVSASEARQIVIAQSRDFNAYRAKLAAAVEAAPAKPETVQQQAQGKIAPKVEDKPLPAEGPKDKLEVSRSEVNKQSKELQSRITALEEDVIARDRALKDANSRVAELERNLADLKKLAEIKSQTGAQMQQQAATSKPVEPVKAPEVPAGGTSAEGSSAPASEAPSVPTTPSTETAAAAPATTVEPPPVPAPVVTEAPPVPVASTQPDSATKPDKEEEPAPPETSFVDENPLLVYGGGGLLVLLLGYLGFSAMRKKKTDDPDTSTVSSLSEGELMANSVFGSTGGQAVDTSASSIQTDFSQASLSAIDADEGVDPVAEADVYMAYGRDAQAEEILVEALKSDPGRMAIYLKLLEIYSASKNLGKFQKVATDLKTQTGGSGADWDKATAMGRAIDPGNPLYLGVQGDSSAAVVLPEAGPIVEDIEFSADSAVSDGTAKPAVDTPQATSLDALPDNLGFDLDLAPAAEVVPVAEPVKAGKPAATPAPAVDEGVADTVSDFKIDLPVVDANRGGEVAETAADSMSGLDFEFDLDTPAPANAAPLEPKVVDFSGIDLDLVTSGAPAASAPAPASAVEMAPVEGDNPDVTTKIELAQAYEEMGDREGARELLEEVLQEGSANQKAIAQSRLAALDA